MGIDLDLDIDHEIKEEEIDLINNNSLDVYKQDLKVKNDTYDKVVGSDLETAEEKKSNDNEGKLDLDVIDDEEKNVIYNNSAAVHGNLIDTQGNDIKNENHDDLQLVLLHSIIDTNGAMLDNDDHEFEIKETVCNMKNDKICTDLWCCSSCQFTNNMQMEYCELCYNERPENPMIFKVSDYLFICILFYLYVELNNI